MVKVGDYKISDYQGGVSSLNPNYGSLFTGYRDSVGNLGSGTDARTANVLQEVSSKISSGAKTIELNQVFPEVFNSIPNQQLEEVRRVSKLTGTDMTFHAPIVGLDPSGMDKQGNFNESQREAVEREMINVINRIQTIKPEGKLPITFHASEGIPETYLEKSPEEDKEIYVVNTDSNAIGKLPIKKRHFTGGKEPSVQEVLEKANKDFWTQNLQSLSYYTDWGERMIKNSQIVKEYSEAKELHKGIISPKEIESKKEFDRGVDHLRDSYRRLETFFETAYKHSKDENDRKKLTDFRDKFKDKINIIEKNGFQTENIDALRDVVVNGEEVLRSVHAPELLKPIKEFAEDKATKTFGNVAFKAYEKFGEKAPMILIENSYAGMAFSRAEDLKKVIEKSKEEFVNKAVESKKLSEKEARKQADKIIGATWDTGRINTIRKYGFEKKDVIKDTEIIAPLVKHVHLSDNFGMEATEIPIGMGNVPTKEIMEKLGKEGFEGKKVLEAMHWWQHFKSPPIQQTFEAFGSPIYSDSVGPYWNQTSGLYQGYYSGLGLFLPQQNFQTYGSGFSMATLPTELGGQMPNGQGSRMSGRGME